MIGRSCRSCELELAQYLWGVRLTPAWWCSMPNRCRFLRVAWHSTEAAVTGSARGCRRCKAMPLFAEDLTGTLGRGADPECGHALELAAARFRPGACALAAEGDWCYKDGRAPTGGALNLQNLCQLHNLGLCVRFWAGARAMAAEGDWCYKDGAAPTGGALNLHNLCQLHSLVLCVRSCWACARWPPRATGAARTAARLPMGAPTPSRILLLQCIPAVRLLHGFFLWSRGTGACPSRGSQAMSQHPCMWHAPKTPW